METNRFFVEENGQWKKTVTRFWRKMEPPSITMGKKIGKKHATHEPFTVSYYILCDSGVVNFSFRPR